MISQWEGIENTFGPIRVFLSRFSASQCLVPRTKSLDSGWWFGSRGEEDGKDDDGPGVIKTAPDSSSTASTLLWLHEWLSPGWVECGHLTPSHQISVFIWVWECAPGRAVTIRITLVTLRTRILRWFKMDITISVLLLIWLTSEWLSSGLFILFTSHTLYTHVTMSVVTISWPGPGSAFLAISGSLSGMMQTLTQLC